MIRRTLVCRNVLEVRQGRENIMCPGGGWWGAAVPTRCSRCGGKLTELAPTYVTLLGDAP
jgi:hypothetical protein